MAADTTGTIQLLNGVAPGTALNQRVGRQIFMTELKYNVLSSVTYSTGVDQVHRVLIVLDHQPNGAALAITDVLDTVATSSLPNLSNQARFKILMDDVYYLNASGEAGSGTVHKGTIGLRTLVQYNSGTAGTVADIATNSLYVISIGNATAGTTAGYLAGKMRLRYRDE